MLEYQTNLTLLKYGIKTIIRKDGHMEEIKIGGIIHICRKEQIMDVAPVAAANITCHLATTQSTLSSLYQYTLTRDNFIGHMNSLYSALNPAAWGVPTLSEFANDTISFAKEPRSYFKSSLE